MNICEMHEKLLILAQFIKTRYFRRFKSVDALRAYQQKMLSEQLTFAAENSAFYRENPDFPVIDKRGWMERFDDINTVGVRRDEAMDFAVSCERSRSFGEKLKGVTVGLSSGTSGHRGIFLVSDRERALWAGTMLAKALPKRHLFGVKIAFFMRADSKLYETVKSRLIKFRFFDMQKNMDDNLRELQEFQPTLLAAPPSCLIKIAVWNEGRKIKPIKVISIAEVLEKPDENVIKDAFGVDAVHQVYQCTEGFLGITCECGTLHLNEDIIKVDKEMLDGERFIPVITDLNRRAQPIINYRLNDVLIEKKESCKCGSPFIALEKIEGRQDDVFEFCGKNGTVQVFPDFIRRCVLFADNVGEYRVRQVSRDVVEVLADGLAEATKRQITDEFKRLAEYYEFDAPAIVFKPYEYDMKRKLKRVEKLC